MNSLECGQCARCLKKQLLAKIRMIAFWTILATASIPGLISMANSAIHPEPPEPPSAEQIARTARIEELSDQLQQAIDQDNEANGIDPRSYEN